MESGVEKHRKVGVLTSEQKHTINVSKDDRNQKKGSGLSKQYLKCDTDLVGNEVVHFFSTFVLKKNICFCPVLLGLLL